MADVSWLKMGQYLCGQCVFSQIKTEAIELEPRVAEPTEAGRLLEWLDVRYSFGRYRTPNFPSETVFF